MEVLACCFIQLARCKEMRAQMRSMLNIHPFLDPRTWDSWEELDSEETGRRVDMLEDTLSSSLKY